MTSTIQNILDWSRRYIPDMKTTTEVVRGEDLGQVTNPTGIRESFYLKHVPVGSIYLYAEPYEFTSSATISGAAASSFVFLFNATLNRCTFGDGESDPTVKPVKFVQVYADYEYSKRLPYGFTDTELVQYLPVAVGHLNNVYGYSFTFTGTIDTAAVTVSGNNDMELVAKQMAVLVRRSYADEQRSRGFGVRFKGPMQSIDSVANMKIYTQETAMLERQVKEASITNRMSNQGAGQVLDIYSEDSVST